jgi:hypothetical protein
MSTYRNCGITDAGDLKLNKFGQKVDLDDKLARLIILGGGSLLPSADFDKISFTDQELKTTPGDGNRVFQEKRKRAWLACHELRTRLEDGGAIFPAREVEQEVPQEIVPESIAPAA